MSKKTKPLACPFCGGDFQIGITDDEGNPHPADYELEPWSGLKFVILHPEKPGVFCPINTFGEDHLGGWSYGSRKEAIKACNTRPQKNEA